MRLIGKQNGKAMWMGMVVLLVGISALAQTASQPEVSKSSRTILISIPDRKLALLEDGKVLKVFPVAVGKESTPSPEGTFTIKSRVANPAYYYQGTVVAPGPENPLGSRWMGPSEKGYGIHGTNAPNSIGKAASHGCIRMAKKDLEELFPIGESWRHGGNPRRTRCGGCPSFRRQGGRSRHGGSREPGSERSGRPLVACVSEKEWR